MTAFWVILLQFIHSILTWVLKAAKEVYKLLRLTAIVLKLFPDRL